MIERIHAFMRRAEEGVCDEVLRTAYGTAMITPSLPLVWQVNAIRVEDPDAGVGELSAEADAVQASFGHRKLVMHVEQLVSLLPEGDFLYPPPESSDMSLHIRLAELVREQVLLRTREEVPHSVEVEIDEIEERESDGLMVVRARVWAETESQKGILVGSGGRMVRAVGTAARQEIEGLLDRRVHLELNVRVRKGWRRDEGLLDRLGIE